MSRVNRGIRPSVGIRLGTFGAALALALVVCRTSRADFLPPGSTEDIPTGDALPLGLTLLASEIMPVTNSDPPGLTGTLASAVYSVAAGGELFAYQVALTTGDTDEVAIGNGVGFLGVTFASGGTLANASALPLLSPFVAGTTNQPTDFSRTLSGGTVNLNFGDYLTGVNTSYIAWLYVPTATTYVNAGAKFLDDYNGNSLALVPVPEPSRVVGLLGLALMGGMGLCFGRMKNRMPAVC